MTWARLGLNTELKHFFDVFPVPPFWAQADVWVPEPMGSASCEATNEGFTPNFLWMSGVQDGIYALQEGSPTWGWGTFVSGFGAGPPNLTPGTTYTVGFNVRPVGGGFAVDWYVDGTLVVTDPGPIPLVGSFNFLILNHSFSLCCCSVVYYTNVLVGTSQGAGDIFSDNFAGGGGGGGGGFDPNWVVESVFNQVPSLAQRVDAPSSDGCPTLTITPSRAQAGSDITLAGHGYTPGSELSLVFANENGFEVVTEFAATVGGGGDFAATIPVPAGVGNPAFFTTTPYPVYVWDENDLLGCSEFTQCGAKPSDGIRSEEDSEGFATNTPDPVVATGGTYSAEIKILDYVYFGGAHWVAWQDPSAIDNAGTFNPIPANHTVTVTRVSADGSSVTDYPVNTGYDFSLGKPPNALGFDGQATFCCPPAHLPCPPGTITVNIPTWDRVWWFESWSKPIYDAKFATDGSNLWLGVLTRESVNYPYATGGSFFDIDSVQAGDPEGYGYQATRPSHSPGSLYDPLIVISTGIPDDFCYRTAFPCDDGGDADSGFWDPPRVRMFCFDGSGFNTIGTMDASFCPGTHEGPEGVCYGVDNTAGAGSFFSGISLAASPAEPGVCHLVWSEGGDWGPWGQAGADANGCPCPLTWDGGPENRDYRVGYSVWTPTAKAAEYDLWHSHIFRGNSAYMDVPFEGFWYDLDGVPTGYTWPPANLFAATAIHQVRNDSGRPLLFLAWMNVLPAGLDYTVAGGENTLRVYDISGGTATPLQQLDPTLLPNETECALSYPNLTPPVESNSIYAPPFNEFSDSTAGQHSISGPCWTFALSNIYKDPLLSDTPVYLVNIPWAHLNSDGEGGVAISARMSAFYRIPVDMSATFDFLDGVRQPAFTIIGQIAGGVAEAEFGHGDFFSDPRNIWLPSPAAANDFYSVGSGEDGLWFDRICRNAWQTLTDAETPVQFDTSTLAVDPGRYACGGFYYDPVADSISHASPNLHSPVGYAFGITTVFICRECANCSCGKGVHIVHRF